MNNNVRLNTYIWNYKEPIDYNFNKLYCLIIV